MPTTPTRFEVIEQDCHGRTHFRAVRVDGCNRTIDGAHQIDFETLADALACVHGHARRSALLPATVEVYRVSFNPRPLRSLIETVDFSA